MKFGKGRRLHKQIIMHSYQTRHILCNLIRESHSDSEVCYRTEQFDNDQHKRYL